MAGEPDAADAEAAKRALAVVPAWTALSSARDAVGLERDVLLHAGPPFATAAGTTKPILNSACVAAVFEGLAGSLDEAEAMLLAGRIRLVPAQDRDVVTPLAAVVSASMTVHVVADRKGSGAVAYAPINGGSRPAMRLGLKSEAVVDHIRWLNGPFAAALAAALTEGVDLLPLAAGGLKAGDDCHGRTPAATALLVEKLRAAAPGAFDEEALDFMNASPSLFLNLWMAATKCMMVAARGVAKSSFVVAAAGNGHQTGIQVSGLPGRWFTHPASPPQGRFDVDLPASRALGAIGDSAVVDAMGLGAMAIAGSQAQLKLLGPYLPADGLARPELLLCSVYPAFAGLKLGLTARRVARAGRGPIVSLGILDRDGTAGRLGGGIYDMPAAPFAAAVAALEG